MSAKRLIEHARALLIQLELARFGIQPEDVKDDLFKVADRAKRDLTQPIVVPEEEILASYLTEHKISSKNDRTFLTETFLGCIRHRKILEATLKLFYEQTGGRYLQSEYYLFAVFCYLALWRLEELGFPRFSKLVRCFDPVKMSRLIGFIFNPVNLEVDLKKAWGFILDHQFLKEHIIDPILRHVGVAQKLLEELCDRVDYGMVVKKSSKKPTESEPFVLTLPHPRKLPKPIEKISNVIKANPVPKSVYEGSGDMLLLERIKGENRMKVLHVYENSNKNQFKVAQRGISNRADQIREQIEKERLAKFERERVKPHKAIPASPHQTVPVKLTTAMILREDALVRKQRRDEQEKLLQAEVSLRDHSEFSQWKDKLRVKEEEERQIELERLRLEVQMAHEDAFVAKQEKLKENREKAAEVQALKEEIKTISDIQKKETEEENKKKIETIHEIKDGIIKAKARMIEEKTKTAAEISQETKQLIEQAQKIAEEERMRKSELIQQIRLLEKNAPSVGTFQKDVDLAETSGMGLLSEMSIVELQERLVLARLRHKDVEDRKRQEIIEHKSNRLEQIAQKLKEIDRERDRRRTLRMQKLVPDRGVSVMSMRSSMTVSDSVREVLFEKDPRLRSLNAKIKQRKAARLAVRDGVFSRAPSVGTALPRPPSAATPRHSGSLQTSRPSTAVSEKWDDLDEAERMYVLHRRDIQREKQRLLDEANRPQQSVPIVELRALHV